MNVLVTCRSCIASWALHVILTLSSAKGKDPAYDLALTWDSFATLRTGSSSFLLRMTAAGTEVGYTPVAGSSTRTR